MPFFRSLESFACLFFLLVLTNGCERVKPYVTGQIEVHYIPCAEMGLRIATTVVLPTSYSEDKNQDRQYPVILLLHGYGGDQSQWQKLTDLPALADRYETILACPNGGKESWYLDSPQNEKKRFETFIMRDVITFIDTTYRTQGAAGRAITGLSMGGHGALRLLSVYPDSFVAAGSMSGILDLRAFPGSWNIAARLGDYEKFPERWAAVSNVNLVKNLINESKGILVDCGRDDFALAVNRAYRDSAAVYGVNITYEETGGGHDRKYWARRLEPQIRFLHSYFPGADK